MHREQRELQTAPNFKLVIDDREPVLDGLLAHPEAPRDSAVRQPRDDARHNLPFAPREVEVRQRDPSYR